MWSTVAIENWGPTGTRIYMNGINTINQERKKEISDIWWMVLSVLL